MRDRARKRRLLGAANIASRDMVKLWGTGVGIELSCRYFSDQPWATAAALAKHHHLSEDTVRRKLDELENIGRVVSKTQGRTKVYRAASRYAERAYQIINRLVETANCDERFP